jgi:2,3,4,5-tetrahydropyridine-2,6-dicarboxylate N-succinyltransferase
MPAQHPLQAEIERHFAAGADAINDPAALRAFTQLRTELNSGRVRSAEPDPAAPLGWRVNAWVKRGILLGFRIGQLTALGNHDLSFVDKGTFPARTFTPEEGIRIVVGGSSVREGAYLARGVICVPPMYVNVGAYIDEGALVDSHALVGSCAQIGKRVHLSAASGHSRRRGRGARLTGDHTRSRRGVGSQPLCSGNREISRR